MAKICVWTRQHIEVLQNLKKTGRHVASAEAIHKNEEAMSMIRADDWLQKAIPDQESRPKDADYPIWVSMKPEKIMLPTPDTVTLQLEVDETLLTYLNIAKWGAVNNCSYIPYNEEDGKRHREFMKACGVSDPEVCMSEFYPEWKREIEKSWDRVFDDSIQLGSKESYGLLWEIKEEWIKKIFKEVV